MDAAVTLKIIFGCSSLQIQAGEGKVYKCLFNHKFEEAMSEKVMKDGQKGIYHRFNELENSY